MTSTTNENNYFPEPAWDNIKAFMMPEKHELPLFPTPSAWALTESGLNFYAANGREFYYDEERFLKKGATNYYGEHPDIGIQTERTCLMENWYYNTNEDENGDEHGFGADPELEFNMEWLMMMGA